MKRYEIVVIGGGPAGLAAAIAAFDAGARDVLILEREEELGGILNQCIHSGFGLHSFAEELTGPEYAARFIEEAEKRGVAYMCSTTVLEVSPERHVWAVNRTEGLFELQAEAIVLAMGCRERSRGALNIPGFRPAGVYSAGTAQRLVNIEGLLPGKRVCILGSGDIGLIMARRLTLEGAKVELVAELLPYSGGLKRNIVQCLNDFGIPLLLNHTVVDVYGRERVEGVCIAQVDEKGRPIAGTEKRYDCDTLLLSCGLIPENELSRAMGVEIDPVTNGPRVNEHLECSVPGVFAAGNVLHVHDLVDYVSEEAACAGRAAAQWAKRGGGAQARRDVPIECGTDVRYVVPCRMDPAHMEESLTLRFRVGRVMKRRFVNVYVDGKRVVHRRRAVMAPGEMEEVKLRRDMFGEAAVQSIRVCVEEA